MGRLIIDDTTIYEIDEACMKNKMQEKNMKETMSKQVSKRSRASIVGSVKERPAP